MPFPLSPIMLVTLLFATGIAVGNVDYINGGHIITMSSIALVTVVSSVVAYMQRHRLWHLWMPPVCLAALIAGWCANRLVWSEIRHDTASLFINPHGNYKGIILDAPHDSRATTRVTVQNSNGCRVMLYIPKPLAHEQSVQEGQTIVFTAHLHPLSARNDSTGYDTHLLHHGVTARGYATNLQVVNTQPRSLSMRIRRICLTRLHEIGLNRQSAALASALLLADRSSLDDETIQDFRNAGISHILALSGMHLGILTGLLVLFFGYDVRDRWRNTFFISIIIWCYALIAGMPLSLVRAATMCTIFMFTRCLRYRVMMFDAVWPALLFMLIVSPHALFDVGVQLSFSAILGLAVTDILMPHRSGNYLVRLLVISVVCFIATLPVSIITFHQVHIYSIPSSILLVPATTLTILFYLPAIFWPQPTVFEAISLWIDLQVSVARFFAHLPFSTITL